MRVSRVSSSFPILHTVPHIALKLSRARIAADITDVCVKIVRDDKLGETVRSFILPLLNVLSPLSSAGF